MNSFSDFLWLLVWAFVFTAYLIVLFQILLDIFRDQDLSGWWKAVWVAFLIIVPIFAALIYVIARGRGMAERHLIAQGRSQHPEAYVPPPIISMSDPADQIASAKALLDQGAITQAEFDQLKQKAMA
jgi:hypothetical protein